MNDEMFDTIMTLVEDTFAHMEKCEALLVEIQMQEKRAYQQVLEATETYKRALNPLKDYQSEG